MIVLDQEKLGGILWTFVKFCEIVFPTFIYFHESYINSANIRQHLSVFPSDFNKIYHKYFGILQNSMRFYKSLRKLMKALIFHSIFLVKSLTFVPFHSIGIFMILYRDKQNFSVCYHTISPLGDIGKYFTIIKRKVIFHNIAETWIL